MSEKRSYVPKYDIFCAQKIIDQYRDVIVKLVGWKAVHTYLSELHSYPISMTLLATKNACKTLNVWPIIPDRSANLSSYRQHKDDVIALAEMMIRLCAELGVAVSPDVASIINRNG